ncbi:family 1 glycosylhydrolase [Microbacterium sp. AGC85]
MPASPPSFLWGASTAPHQIEGNNVNRDWWALELSTPGMEPSGDALDSYHRYGEDMRLVADAGLTAYRFGIEWARIEPAPGQFSQAELQHYRRMIDEAFRLGLTPVITLQHFSTPQWFSAEGGWLVDSAVDRFRAYVQAVAPILDGVEWVCTINEPNMLAMMSSLVQAVEHGDVSEWQSPTTDGAEGGTQPVLPAPDPEIGRRLARAHVAAREVLKASTGAAVGWTIANQAFYASPENEPILVEERFVREDFYLEVSRDDDFVGVQAYSTQEIGKNGPIPHAPHPDNTMIGTPYRPDAVGIAARHAWDVTNGTPVLVTENGIATTDDTRRIAYTTDALASLFDAMDDGVDVRGYLHWSLLDNYEWGHWGPTFGLASVDRDTFVRTPKPSLAWLGGVARSGNLHHPQPAADPR